MLNRNGRGNNVKLEIRLHGECAARFDSEADLLGWVAGEPTETMAIWRRMSVNAWAPETGIATHWLEGLLPEGLSREPFETRAARAGPDARAGRGVITLFWGNWDHEYAGAVEIAREDKPKERPGWRRIDEAELGALVADNARERAQRGRPRWPPADIWRKSALTGMRGKLGIRRTGTEWALATGSGLSTWIVKHEDRPELPGEAGTEAIMQRALACIGVRTARTESRMFGGMQCVLSERSDRNDWGGGVEAVHQEDFLQASGWPAQRKYEERVRGEPGYAELYRMLREHSADPEGEQAMLTRLIAACVMGASADMHRKNIGLLHEAGTQIPRVTLAPVYDFGSWAGLERTFAGRGEAQGKLALGVNGIDEPSRIGVKQWIAMAEQAGADTEGTVEEVKAVGRALPEAIAQARAEAQTTDENRDQGWVDRRVEATVRYAQRRARALEQEIESRARKGRSRGTTLMNARENKRTETGGTTLRKPEDDGYPQHDKWMDEAASEVWTRLGTLPGGLHLYGGAAFALYLGHRTPGGLDWADGRGAGHRQRSPVADGRQGPRVRGAHRDRAGRVHDHGQAHGEHELRRMRGKDPGTGRAGTARAAGDARGGTARPRREQAAVHRAADRGARLRRPRRSRTQVARNHPAGRREATRRQTRRGKGVTEGRAPGAHCGRTLGRAAQGAATSGGDGKYERGSNAVNATTPIKASSPVA